MIWRFKLTILFKDFTIGSEKNILKLFSDSFGRDLPLDYWTWRYLNNPQNKLLIKLAEDIDLNKLVAHYALSPTEVFINGVKFNSAISMTTMTHPDYQGLKLFTSLANQLYKENSDKLDLIYGVPNDNSLKGFIKHLGFNLISEIYTYKLDSLKLKVSKSDSCSEITRFKSSLDNLIENAYNKYPVILSRNIQHLNWRYVDNPSNTYRKFCISHGEQVTGYIVTKHYRNLKVNEVDIVDILSENSIVFEELICHVIAIYKEQNITNFNIWMNDMNYVHSLKKIGFELSDDSFHFISKKNSDKINASVDDFSNWYITMGDIDIF